MDSHIVSVDDICQFRDLGRVAIDGIVEILSHSNYLTRWIMTLTNPRLLQIVPILNKKSTNDYEEVKDELPYETIAGYIKCYCGLAVNYYGVNTLLPIGRKLVKINIFANTTLNTVPENFKLICLTRRELFHALKYIGESGSRAILSYDVDRFDCMFASLCDNDFVKFKGLVDDTNIEALSALTIHAVLCKRIQGPLVLKSFISFGNQINRYKQSDDAICELVPSHISYWSAFEGLKPNMPNCNDTKYVEGSVALYYKTQTYISELNALLQFILSSGTIGRAKREEIKGFMEKSSFLSSNGNISFNPYEVTQSELLSLYPIYSDIAIKYIRQEIKESETLSEYEDSSVGFNLDCFLRDNFNFYGNRYYSFKNNAYKYFSKLCELITNVINDKRGGQKNTYALLYLFFPVHKNQNSDKDLLIGQRLNDKYLQWKNEPKNTEEAFQRLVKHFPSLLHNHSNGQPSLPSRSRDAITKWINEGQTWLPNFMRDIWTPIAIEKSGFKKFTSERPYG